MSVLWSSLASRSDAAAMAYCMASQAVAADACRESQVARDVLQRCRVELEAALRAVYAFMPTSRSERNERCVLGDLMGVLGHALDEDWLVRAGRRIELSVHGPGSEPADGAEDEPDHISMSAMRAVHADCDLAQRFWDVFQVCDPGGVFPFRFCTGVSARYLRSAFHAVRNSRPRSAGQFGEKVKVVACYGLARTIALAEHFGWIDDQSLDEVRRCLVDLMGMTAGVVLSAVASMPVLEGLDAIVDQADWTPWDRKVGLLRLAIGGAGMGLVTMLANEAKRFGNCPEDEF